MPFKPHLHTHMIAFPHSRRLREEAEEDEEETRGEGVHNRRYHRHHHHHHDTSPYKPLYEISNAYLSNGYSVLYGAESIPNETAKAKVVENIQSATNTEEAQFNISKGLLTVVNADLMYKENANSRDILDFWYSNVSKIQRKLQKRTIKGIMMFSAPDPYLKRDRYDIFRMFEEQMGKIFPTKVGMICWYKEKWLSKLSLASLISILINHKYTIYSDWKYKELDVNEIIHLISKGIDKKLGEGSATLLFQTMKTVYKLNQDIVVSKPAVFEDKLKRLLDNSDDANSVIYSIFEEIIKEVAYSRKKDTSSIKD